MLTILNLLEARQYSVPRVQMIQRQSCYYTPFDKQLTCQCTNSETNTFLKLRLMFFIKEKGQEVRSVLIQSCEDLLVGLDLTGVNPTQIPIKFKNCGKVSFSFINFDRQFTGGQMIKFHLETVNSVKMEGLEVKDAMQIKTNRVKELLLTGNRFTHIPLPGFEIVHADKLVINDNYFHRISPGSITVKSAKEVEVINNQFSINADRVVDSSEGSRLYISCNRLLGQSISLECVTTTTTTTLAPSTTTTTTTTSTTAVIMTTESKELMLGNNNEEVKSAENGLSVELLIGLVVGVAVLILVLLIVVVILCCRRRQQKAKAESKVKEDTEKLDILAEKDDDKDSGNNSADTDSPEPDPERQSLLQTQDVNPLIEAAKPKFSSPVWLDEIQNNKIFNKQRSINTEENITPKRTKKAFPVRSISEIIDSDSDDIEDKDDIEETNNASPVNNNNQFQAENEEVSESEYSENQKKVIRETDL